MKSVNNFTQKYNNMSVNTQIYVNVGNSYTYLCSYGTQTGEIYQIPEMQNKYISKNSFSKQNQFYAETISMEKQEILQCLKR